MPKLNFYLLLLTICYAFLAGCGTKGPLYIPEQRYPPKTQQDAPAKTPDSNTSQPTKE